MNNATTRALIHLNTITAQAITYLALGYLDQLDDLLADDPGYFVDSMPALKRDWADHGLARYVENSAEDERIFVLDVLNLEGSAWIDLVDEIGHRVADLIEAPPQGGDETAHYRSY